MVNTKTKAICDCPTCRFCGMRIIRCYFCNTVFKKDDIVYCDFDQAKPVWMTKHVCQKCQKINKNKIK